MRVPLAFSPRLFGGVVAFKANWLLLVLGQERWLHWAPLLLGVQLFGVLPPAFGPALRRLAAVALFAACGLAFDALLLQLGLLRLPEAGVPLWLGVLWFAFGCVLAQMQDALRRAPAWLLMLAGSAAGTLGYGAAALLGAVAFGLPVPWMPMLLLLPWSCVLLLARALFAAGAAPIAWRRT